MSNPDSLDTCKFLYLLGIGLLTSKPATLLKVS